MSGFTRSATLLAFAGVLAFVGCKGQQEEFQEYGKSEKAAPEEHDHGHHEHGPHDGHVLELGDHEYHAEVVMDAATKKVTVYILGHELSESHAIDAAELTLTLDHDGKEHEVTLVAVPQEGDPEGKSSRFEVADDPIIKEHVADIEELHGHLTVPVDGKLLEAEISHDHEHGHAHGEGEKAAPKAE